MLSAEWRAFLPEKDDLNTMQSVARSDHVHYECFHISLLYLSNTNKITTLNHGNDSGVQPSPAYNSSLDK